MSTFTYTPTPAQQTLDAGQIQAYLLTQGITAGVSIQVDAAGAYKFLIETDATGAQLQAAAQSYTVQPSERQSRRDQLAALYPKLQAGTATNREAQTALALALLVLRDLDNG